MQLYTFTITYFIIIIYYYSTKIYIVFFNPMNTLQTCVNVFLLQSSFNGY